MGINVLSLFNGISCGRVALERAEIEVDRYVSYEIDKYANQVATFNYPTDEYCGDVTTADFMQYKGFDLVIGGSPCTSWSICNKKREVSSTGIGYELFMQFVRAVKETNCKYFLYENNHSIHPNIKKEIAVALGVDFICINSALLSGQNRKRIYFTNIPNIIQPLDKQIHFGKEIAEEQRQDWRPYGKWLNAMFFNTKKKSEIIRPLTCEKTYCLTTKKGHPQNYYCNEERTHYTNLTITEYEKLQTLPVDYTSCIKNQERYKCIGNGWTVDVIAHILKNIK